MSETMLLYTAGTCSLSVQVALERLGEPYGLCRVDRSERASAEFLRMNPQGKVPVLVVGERALSEVSAILQHLAARRPDAELLPAVGAPDYDACNQWLSYLGSGFHAAFYPYYTPQRFSADEAGHAAIKTAALEQIRKHLGIVERALTSQRYVLGATRSALDPYLYSMSRWTRKMFDLAREFPSVARHQADVETDAAVQIGLAIERGDVTTPPSGSALARHVLFGNYAATAPVAVLT